MSEETTNDFSNELAELEDSYAAVVPISEDLIPEGTHQLRIENMNLVRVTKDDGSYMAVTTDLSVLTGEAAGKTTTVWDRLNNEKGIGFFKEKLKRLELDHTRPLSEVEAVIAEASGLIVTAQVKHNKGQGGRVFVNVYIQRLDGRDESTQ